MLGRVGEGKGERKTVVVGTQEGSVDRREHLKWFSIVVSKGLVIFEATQRM